MTTANEPSVAELVDQVRTCELNDFQAEETADLLAQAFARLERRCEMLQVEVGTLQGVSASLRGNRNVQRVLDLERRCAEMEKALRQVPRYDLDGACEGESGYCREGLARDDNGDWVLYSAVAALLPPERANEGKGG